MITTQHYRIEQLPGEPILLFEATKYFKVMDDWQQGDIDVRKFLDQASEPLYHLVDVTKATLTLDDIVLAVNKLSREESALWRHPNHRALLFVTTNDTIRMAVRGLNSLMFGNVRAEIFEKQEDALAYCRAKIAGGKKTNPH